jgi:tetratricopeptide (TPR) repeat protein
VELEPRSVGARYQRTLALLALQRYHEAIRECDSIIDIEASLPGAGPTTQRGWPRALRGYAQARAGRRADAEASLEEVRQLAARQYVPPYHEALVLHALGRPDEALVRLRKAVEARDVFVTFLGVDPKWDELRASPEFKALASRVNLLDVSNRTLAARR